MMSRPIWTVKNKYELHKNLKFVCYCDCASEIAEGMNYWEDHKDLTVSIQDTLKFKDSL